MGGSAHAGWLAGMETELSFWRRYFEGAGLEWPDEYRARLDPDLPVQPPIADHLPTGRPARILDCAAGPATTVGKVFDGRRVDLVCVDALSDRYAEMLEELGVVPPVPSIQGEVESLDELGLRGFAVVYMRFALDHCHDPLRAIGQMVAAARPGGAVIIEHYRDADRHEEFAGLRQWALDPAADDLTIRNGGQRHSVAAAVSPATLTMDFDDQWLTATIR